MIITLFGLGEAGGLIGRDLARLLLQPVDGHGHSDNHSDIAEKTPSTTLRGFDPKPVETPVGIERFDDPAAAVAGADFVLSFTSANDAGTALQQGLDTIPGGSVYADFASASSALKAELAVRASEKQLLFVDVAMMAMVPGNGIKTASLCSGTGSTRLIHLLSPLGMPLTQVSDQPGDAAQRKLLRSVVIKGLAGLLIESLQGAQQAGCEQWVWQNLVDEFTAMDQSMLERLVNGTAVHAGRRLHEMEAASNQLQDLAVEPLMTTSTVKSLSRVLQQGVPEIPSSAPEPQR